MRRAIKISLIVLAALAAFVILVEATQGSIGDEAYEKAMSFDDAGTPEAEIIREAGEPTRRVDAREGCHEEGGTYELVYARESYALWGWLRVNRKEILICIGPDKTRRGRGVTWVEYH